MVATNEEGRKGRFEGRVGGGGSGDAAGMDASGDLCSS